MTWAAHGGSSAFVVLILATFVLRALAGRRRQPGTGGAPGFRAWPGSPGPRRTAGGAGGGAPGAGGWGAGSAPGDGHTGVPPGWLPDPTGRYQQRYWSGRAWTEHVTSGGVPAADPPPAIAGTGPPGE
jgi:Protein of unknown function (DUF2510)